MHRKIASWGTAVWFAMAAAGCADTAILDPASPDPEGLRPSADYGVPDESDVPEEYRYPVIHDMTSQVGFGSGVATASGAMLYLGNRAEATATLTVTGLNPNSKTVESKSGRTLVSDNQIHSVRSFNVIVDGSCGHAADITIQFTAKSVFFMESTLTSREAEDATDSQADQDECGTYTETVKIEGGGKYEEDGAGEGEGGERWCDYLIFYDMQTGEIIHAVRLQCYNV